MQYLIVLLAAIAIFGATAFVLRMIPNPLRSNIVVAVVILYLVGGFSYAIYTAIFNPPASWEFEEHDNNIDSIPYRGRSRD